jgi:hypothetical protein
MSTVNDKKRVSRFRAGLLCVLIPIALFVPALAFLTICPPEHAEGMMIVFLSTATISELLGLRKLLLVCERTFDLLTVVSICGVLFDIAFVTLLVWGALRTQWG